MPHKRNPVVAERICGLARVVRAAAGVGLENVALWHERDISHSSAERVVLPDSFLALDYMLDRFAWLIGGARRAAGADAAQHRGEPRALLQPAPAARARRAAGSRATTPTASCSRSRSAPGRTSVHLADLARAEDAVTARLGPDELAAVFSLEPYTRHVDTVFERLHALERKEEPVHA